MGRKSLYLLIMGVLVAYYVYIPLPGDFEDPWKLICLNAKMKTIEHLAKVIKLLGLNNFADSIKILLYVKEVPPISDENITVTDTTFNHIPVRVYVPKKQSKALRGIFYIHGGGCITESAASDYYLSIISQCKFEDVYNSLKWFLRKEVLAKHDVNPERIGVVGSSSGGNLAAAVTQKRFIKGHVYNNPTYGSSELSKKYPGLSDVRVSPLLADDKKSRGLPRTHIITCQYDIFRDDGLMYVTRLQNAGVPVTHNHIENGMHVLLLYSGLKITHKMKNQYVSWLSENL